MLLNRIGWISRDVTQSRRAVGLEQQKTTRVLYLLEHSWWTSAIARVSNNVNCKKQIPKHVRNNACIPILTPSSHVPNGNSPVAQVEACQDGGPLGTCRGCPMGNGCIGIWNWSSVRVDGRIMAYLKFMGFDQAWQSSLITGIGGWYKTCHAA